MASLTYFVAEQNRPLELLRSIFILLLIVFGEKGTMEVQIRKARDCYNRCTRKTDPSSSTFCKPNWSRKERHIVVTVNSQCTVNQTPSFSQHICFSVAWLLLVICETSFSIVYGLELRFSVISGILLLVLKHVLIAIGHSDY